MDWKYVLALLGASTAWVWSVFTWFKSQAAQRTQTEFIRKETLYRELLRTLNVFYKGGPGTGVAAFLEQYRLAWLYAPDEVIRQLKLLLESLKIDPEEERYTAEQKQSARNDRDEKGKEAIANAVAAIRRDLFETAGRSTELHAQDFGHYS